ncbi:hypothetical protein D3C86_2028050 [compost metagenome]
MSGGESGGDDFDDGCLTSGGDPGATPADAATTAFFLNVFDWGAISRSMPMAVCSFVMAASVLMLRPQRLALPLAPEIAARSFSIQASSAFSATTE